jgi:hypothetical protein
MKAKELLIAMNACYESIEWVGDRTIQEAWQECERGDWMLWFYAKQHPEKIRELTLAKGHCANTVRHLMKDKRSINAVDAAIKYGNGLINDDELKIAASAASSATSATYAAYAAAYAASATSAAYAAAYAASATSAAYAASYARKENYKLTADICRKYLKLEDK